MTSTIVNSAGLVLNIVGTLLVWRYGLPAPLSRDGAINIIAEQTDNSEKAEAAKYDCKARLGIGLLLLGFALQLVSSLVRC
jgi:hypothetical protein